MKVQTKYNLLKWAMRLGLIPSYLLGALTHWLFLKVTSTPILMECNGFWKLHALFIFFGINLFYVPTTLALSYIKDHRM